MLTAIVAAVINFDHQRTNAAANFLAAAASSGTDPQQAKLDRIVAETIDPAWPSFTLKLTAIALGIFAVGILLLVWLANMVDSELRGFVLLTKRSETERDEYLAREAHRWIWLGLATVASVANGVFANVLFDRFAS